MSPLSVLLLFILVCAAVALPKRPEGLEQDKVMVERREPKNSSHLKRKILQGYDKNQRPFNGVQPVMINVSAGIISVGDVNEAKMGFGVDMYLRQRWVDPRLAYGPNDENASTIIFRQNEIGNLWLPDTQFFSAENEDKSRGNSAMVSNDGTVLYVFRAHVTASQQMDFRDYPFDYQNLEFTLSSYIYDVSKVQYDWESLTLYDIHHPEFDIRSVTKSKRNEVFFIGNYSMLDIRFKLAREVEHFLLLVYFPSFLCTAISWFALWLDPADISNRIALILAILLAAVFLLSQANYAMPSVGYLKRIDWFLIVSILFILFTLLQSLIVYSITENQEVGKEPNAEDQQVEKNTIEGVGNATNGKNPGGKESKFKVIIDFKIKACKKNLKDFINKLSKVVLPACYIIYCAVAFQKVSYRADFE